MIPLLILSYKRRKWDSASATLESEMSRLEAQLTDKRNQRDTLYTQIWDKVKRVRNGVKGIYGDDSSQYEMIGGTRLRVRPWINPAGS